MARKQKPVTLAERDGWKTDGMYQSGGPVEKYDPEVLKQSGDDFNYPALDRIRDIREWLTKAITPHIDGPLDKEAFIRGELPPASGGWNENITLSTGAGLYHINAERHTWVEDAIDALRKNKQLEQALADGNDLDCIVRLSVRLGQLMQRVEARAVFAPLVLAEVGRRKGARKTAIDILNADHAELRSGFQAEVERIMEEQNICYSPACVKAAPVFGVSERTIRTHTQNPRPRNKGPLRKVGKR